MRCDLGPPALVSSVLKCQTCPSQLVSGVPGRLVYIYRFNSVERTQAYTQGYLHPPISFSLQQAFNRTSSPAIMSDKDITPEQAINLMANVSTKLRECILQSLPCALEQFVTISIPGQIIDTKVGGR